MNGNLAMLRKVQTPKTKQELLKSLQSLPNFEFEIVECDATGTVVSTSQVTAGNSDVGRYVSASITRKRKPASIIIIQHKK
jgi:hypothetical protein